MERRDLRAAELLTTRDALERLGWRSRSSLHRAEKAGRISRARTVRGRPLYRVDDVAKLIGPRAASAEASARAHHDTSRRDRADGSVEERRYDDLEDAELAVIRAELEKLAARGEDALEGARALRLLASAIRRRLVLREARGEAVLTAEVADLMQLELRVKNLDAIERANARTRRPRR